MNHCKIDLMVVAEVLESPSEASASGLEDAPVERFRLRHSWFSHCKRAALPGYYAATWPLRKAMLARLSARGRAPIIVVAYHRVADDAATDWTIATSVFRRQMGWLRRHFDLVSLPEAQRRIASTTNHTPTVSVTFDDGYADNCKDALPLLLRERIPFTYFVTSEAVLEGRFFEHDQDLGLRLQPNTPEQLRELVSDGVEIDAHTRTHANLGHLPDAGRLHDEVVGARDELQEALDCRIRYFAFPFGQHANLSRAAFALAAEAGYEGVVSAYGGYNFPGDDPFHMQRPCVDGPDLKLRNAATLDPYKLWTIPRYQYNG